MSELRDAVNLLERWVDIDSTTDREATFLEALEEWFEERGWRCERQEITDTRWNLLVRRGSNPRILYSTHVDTVPPFIAPEVRGEALYGRGACDTKGGIVAMCKAGERLLAEGSQGFGYLFVVGEEVDHRGARAARHLELDEVERIILCEPTENRVVAAQKGMVKMYLRARGIAGHSAYPDRGVSAVHHLLDALQRMRDEPWPSDPLLGPTTMNVGVIEGGVAANVFAPEARAEVLIRAVAPVAPMIERLRELAGNDVSIAFPASNDPVVFDPPDGAETCTVAFNTDASYLTDIAPVWLVGPGDIQVAHSIDEHITFESLARGIDLYTDLGRLSLS